MKPKDVIGLFLLIVLAYLIYLALNPLIEGLDSCPYGQYATTQDCSGSSDPTIGGCCYCPAGKAIHNPSVDGNPPLFLPTGVDLNERDCSSITCNSIVSGGELVHNWSSFFEPEVSTSSVSNPIIYENQNMKKIVLDGKNLEITENNLNLDEGFDVSVKCKINHTGKTVFDNYVNIKENVVIDKCNQSGGNYKISGFEYFECSPCESGKYSDGIEECRGLGDFADAQPEPCPNGEYKNINTDYICQTCPNGKYSENTASYLPFLPYDDHARVSGGGNLGAGPGNSYTSTNSDIQKGNMIITSGGESGIIHTINGSNFNISWSLGQSPGTLDSNFIVINNPNSCLLKMKEDVDRLNQADTPQEHLINWQNAKTRCEAGGLSLDYKESCDDDLTKYGYKWDRGLCRYDPSLGGTPPPKPIFDEGGIKRGDRCFEPCLFGKWRTEKGVCEYCLENYEPAVDTGYGVGTEGNEKYTCNKCGDNQFTQGERWCKMIDSEIDRCKIEELETNPTDCEKLCSREIGCTWGVPLDGTGNDETCIAECKSCGDKELNVNNKTCVPKKGCLPGDDECIYDSDEVCPFGKGYLKKSKRIDDSFCEVCPYGKYSQTNDQKRCKCWEYEDETVAKNTGRIIELDSVTVTTDSIELSFSSGEKSDIFNFEKNIEFFIKKGFRESDNWPVMGQESYANIAKELTESWKGSLAKAGRNLSPGTQEVTLNGAQLTDDGGLRLRQLFAAFENARISIDFLAIYLPVEECIDKTKITCEKGLGVVTTPRLKEGDVTFNTNNEITLSPSRDLKVDDYIVIHAIDNNNNNNIKIDSVISKVTRVNGEQYTIDASLADLVGGNTYQYEIIDSYGKVCSCKEGKYKNSDGKCEVCDSQEFTYEDQYCEKQNTKYECEYINCKWNKIAGPAIQLWSNQAEGKAKTVYRDDETTGYCSRKNDECNSCEIFLWPRKDPNPYEIEYVDAGGTCSDDHIRTKVACDNASETWTRTKMRQPVQDSDLKEKEYIIRGLLTEDKVNSGDAHEVYLDDGAPVLKENNANYAIKCGGREDDLHSQSDSSVLMVNLPDGGGQQPLCDNLEEKSSQETGGSKCTLKTCKKHKNCKFSYKSCIKGEETVDFTEYCANGYTPGDATNPSTTCRTGSGCTLTQAVAASDASCTGDINGDVSACVLNADNSDCAGDNTVAGYNCTFTPAVSASPETCLAANQATIIISPEDKGKIKSNEKLWLSHAPYKTCPAIQDDGKNYLPINLTVDRISINDKTVTVNETNPNEMLKQDDIIKFYNDPPGSDCQLNGKKFTVDSIDNYNINLKEDIDSSNSANCKIYKFRRFYIEKEEGSSVCVGESGESGESGGDCPDVTDFADCLDECSEKIVIKEEEIESNIYQSDTSTDIDISQINNIDCVIKRENDYGKCIRVDNKTPPNLGPIGSEIIPRQPPAAQEPHYIYDGKVINGYPMTTTDNQNKEICKFQMKYNSEFIKKTGKNNIDMCNEYYEKPIYHNYIVTQNDCNNKGYMWVKGLCNDKVSIDEQACMINNSEWTTKMRVDPDNEIEGIFSDDPALATDEDMSNGVCLESPCFDITYDRNELHTLINKVGDRDLADVYNRDSKWIEYTDPLCEGGWHKTFGSCSDGSNGWTGGSRNKCEATSIHKWSQCTDGISTDKETCENNSIYTWYEAESRCTDLSIYPIPLPVRNANSRDTCENIQKHIWIDDATYHNPRLFGNSGNCVAHPTLGGGTYHNTSKGDCELYKHDWTPTSCESHYYWRPGYKDLGNPVFGTAAGTNGPITHYSPIPIENIDRNTQTITVNDVPADGYQGHRTISPGGKIRLENKNNPICTETAPLFRAQSVPEDASACSAVSVGDEVACEAVLGSTAAIGIADSWMPASANSIELASADPSIYIGQKLRLVDKPGRTCEVSPKGSDLEVQDVAANGAVITFTTDLTGDDQSASENCEIIRGSACTYTPGCSLSYDRDLVIDTVETLQPGGEYSIKLVDGSLNQGDSPTEDDCKITHAWEPQWEFPSEGLRHQNTSPTIDITTHNWTQKCKIRTSNVDMLGDLYKDNNHIIGECPSNTEIWPEPSDEVKYGICSDDDSQDSTVCLDSGNQWRCPINCEGQWITENDEQVAAYHPVQKITESQALRGYWNNDPFYPLSADDILSKHDEDSSDTPLCTGPNLTNNMVWVDARDGGKAASGASCLAPGGEVCEGTSTETTAEECQEKNCEYISGGYCPFKENNWFPIVTDPTIVELPLASINAIDNKVTVGRTYHEIEDIEVGQLMRLENAPGKVCNAMVVQHPGGGREEIRLLAGSGIDLEVKSFSGREITFEENLILSTSRAADACGCPPGWGWSSEPIARDTTNCEVVAASGDDTPSCNIINATAVSTCEYHAAEPGTPASCGSNVTDYPCSSITTPSSASDCAVGCTFQAATDEVVGCEVELGSGGATGDTVCVLVPGSEARSERCDSTTADGVKIENDTTNCAVIGGSWRSSSIVGDPASCNITNAGTAAGVVTCEYHPAESATPASCNQTSGTGTCTRNVITPRVDASCGTDTVEITCADFRPSEADDCPVGCTFQAEIAGQGERCESTPADAGTCTTRAATSATEAAACAAGTVEEAEGWQEAADQADERLSSLSAANCVLSTAASRKDLGGNTCFNKICEHGTVKSGETPWDYLPWYSNYDGLTDAFLNPVSLPLDSDSVESRINTAWMHAPARIIKNSKDNQDCIECNHGDSYVSVDGTNKYCTDPMDKCNDNFAPKPWPDSGHDGDAPQPNHICEYPIEWDKWKGMKGRNPRVGDRVLDSRNGRRGFLTDVRVGEVVDILWNDVPASSPSHNLTPEIVGVVDVTSINAYENTVTVSSDSISPSNPESGQLMRIHGMDCGIDTYLTVEEVEEEEDDGSTPRSWEITFTNISYHQEHLVLNSGPCFLSRGETIDDSSIMLLYTNDDPESDPPPATDRATCQQAGGRWRPKCFQCSPQQQNGASQVGLAGKNGGECRGDGGTTIDNVTKNECWNGGHTWILPSQGCCLDNKVPAGDNKVCDVCEGGKYKAKDGVASCSAKRDACFDDAGCRNAMKVASGDGNEENNDWDLYNGALAVRSGHNIIPINNSVKCSVLVDMNSSEESIFLCDDLQNCMDNVTPECKVCPQGKYSDDVNNDNIGPKACKLCYGRGGAGPKPDPEPRPQYEYMHPMYLDDGQYKCPPIKQSPLADWSVGDNGENTNDNAEACQCFDCWTHRPAGNNGITSCQLKENIWFNHQYLDVGAGHPTTNNNSFCGSSGLGLGVPDRSSFRSLHPDWDSDDESTLYWSCTNGWLEDKVDDQEVQSRTSCARPPCAGYTKWWPTCGVTTGVPVDGVREELGLGWLDRYDVLCGVQER